MPRSFLVKKVKLDDFPAGLESPPYGRARADFGSRLHEKGKYRINELPDSLITHREGSPPAHRRAAPRGREPPHSAALRTGRGRGNRPG